jgi:outer membrane protein OmpA-like peptidoglycan-associated protein
MQLFEGVCLSDRMVAYLKCLDRSGNARLRVVQDEKTAKPSNLTVEVAGAAGGKILKGSGRVMVDRRSDEQSIRRLDQAISPHALTACLRASTPASAGASAKAGARAGAPLPPPPPADGNGGTTRPSRPAFHTTRGDVIGFQPDKTDFEDSKKANEQIRVMAKELKALPDGSAAVIGTAVWPREKLAAAKGLAQRRVTMIRDLLVAAGVPPKNLSVELRDDTSGGSVLVDGVTVNWTSGE